MSLRSVCACAVVVVSAGSSPHLRTGNGRILEVMQAAIERSPVFRSLIDAIDASGRTVYVDEGPCARTEARSCVQPLPGSVSLRVLVDPRSGLVAVARQLAHEFQHVVEIAAAPDAIDPPTIRHLYERIGFQSCEGCYETRQALDVEARVSREVSSGHAPSMTAFFGTWTLNTDRSSYSSCRPTAARRFDRDQRHGLASAVVEYVDCFGVEHRDNYVYSAGGRDYPLASADAQSSRTIAVNVLDDLTMAFVIKEHGVVVACGRRTLRTDGRTMTIETWTAADEAAPRRTLEIWEKDSR